MKTSTVFLTFWFRSVGVPLQSLKNAKRKVERKILFFSINEPTSWSELKRSKSFPWSLTCLIFSLTIRERVLRVVCDICSKRFCERRKTASLPNSNRRNVFLPKTNFQFLERNFRIDRKFCSENRRKEKSRENRENSSKIFWRKISFVFREGKVFLTENLEKIVFHWRRENCTNGEFVRDDFRANRYFPSLFELDFWREKTFERPRIFLRRKRTDRKVGESLRHSSKSTGLISIQIRRTALEDFSKFVARWTSRIDLKKNRWPMRFSFSFSIRKTSAPFDDQGKVLIDAFTEKCQMSTRSAKENERNRTEQNRRDQRIISSTDSSR